MSETEKSTRLGLLVPGSALVGLVISICLVGETRTEGQRLGLWGTAGLSLAVGLGYLLLRRRGGARARKPACIVNLAGRLDAHVADTYRRTLKEIIEQGHVNLLFDCQRVTIIDSGGLGVLITTLKAVTPQNGAVALAHLQDRLRQLFQVTRLEKVFPSYGTTAEALEALGWEKTHEIAPLLTRAGAGRQHA